MVRRVSPDELKDTCRAMEAGSHARFHRLDRENLHETAVRSAEELSALPGQPVRGLAYPGGHYTHELAEALRALGVFLARTTAVTHDFACPADWIEMHPACHIHDPALPGLIERFRQCESGLFHVYAHSYELTQCDPQKNWDALAKTLDELAGWSGVDYLTNGQACERLNGREASANHFSESRRAG